jgi:hypothetical protein
VPFTVISAPEGVLVTMIERVSSAKRVAQDGSIKDESNKTESRTMLRTM